MQYTVAIIKPHAVVNRIKIVQLLKDAGFRIVGERYVEINVDEAWYLCKDEAGKVAADNLHTENRIQALLGTAMVLLLTHERAYELMSEIIGPDDPVDARKKQPNSIRARFGDVGAFNVLAVSESYKMAVRNIQHFFPRFSDTLNGPTSDVSQERIQIDAYFREKMLPTLLDAFYDMATVKPAEPVTHLSQFLLNNNPNHPKVVRPEDANMKQ
ncbi:putative Nucleoside diphosphate kinase-like protein 5 [Hypsibius exemplaris]|uniref:Nucleoside diphosphate kinase-like protein 5 n=1 Tax=Hypsibius exemplaris TaxID=2072580 RepID=A0A1W0WFT3_HYPEX|nr:putative Nucleoside diphosphate kinase-like protein 5 [Hypsibius exemplaris]